MRWPAPQPIVGAGIGIYVGLRAGYIQPGRRAQVGIAAILLATLVVALLDGGD